MTKLRVTVSLENWPRKVPGPSEHQRAHLESAISCALVQTMGLKDVPLAKVRPNTKAGGAAKKDK